MGSRVTAVAVVGAAVAGLGCGDAHLDAMTVTDCQTAGGALLPWNTGNTWTYAVYDEGIPGMKETVVGAMEVVGGTGPNKDAMALKVVTQKDWMNETTVSWQIASGDSVIRFREQSFSAFTSDLETEDHWDPHKLHVDGSAARRVKGESWTEIYQETKLPVGGTPSTHEAHDRWSVLSACERVTVPAGTFAAVLLQKLSPIGAAKTYWYVPGVGKVKESGNQIEELVSYALVP
jgi:hypothetical protein